MKFIKKLLIITLLLPILGVSQKWEKKYDFVDNCVCGLSRVKKDGKIGYVNKDGIEVIKPQYEEGLTYNEGYTAVRTGTKWMYIDSTGKAITPAIYDDAVSFRGGLAAIAKSNMYGYIDTGGQLVIPCEFSNTRSFSEGLAPAANAKGFWGFIDSKGKWIIKPVYDYADNFESDQAKVIKGDKIFFIDKMNNVVKE